MTFLPNKTPIIAAVKKILILSFFLPSLPHIHTLTHTHIRLLSLVQYLDNIILPCTVLWGFFPTLCLRAQRNMHSFQCSLQLWMKWMYRQFYHSHLAPFFTLLKDGIESMLGRNGLKYHLQQKMRWDFFPLLWCFSTLECFSGLGDEKEDENGASFHILQMGN